MRLPLFGLLCAALISSPAFAEDAVCAYKMDDVIASQLKDKPVSMVPADEIPALLADLEAATGQKYEGVTRAFLTNIDGNILLGLEVGGCLLDPIVIATMPAPASSTRSGRVGDLVFA